MTLKLTRTDNIDIHFMQLKQHDDVFVYIMTHSLSFLPLVSVLTLFTWVFMMRKASYCSSCQQDKNTYIDRVIFCTFF